MEKKKKNIVALGITIIFTLIVIWNVNFRELITYCKLLNSQYILPYMVIFVFVMLARTIRWRELLPKSKCKLVDFFELYMTSNFINVFLPARAGDLFRGIFFGQKYKMPKLSIIGTVLAERILDGLAVICLLSLGIILHYRSQFVINLLLIAIIMFVGSFIFMIWVYQYKKVDFVCDKIKEGTKKLPKNISDKIQKFIDSCNPHLNAFVDGFKTFTDLKIMGKVAILSAISWLGDCFLVCFLLSAFGINSHFSISFFIVSFIAFSTIIPQSSMYIGLYQGAFILGAGLFGINKTIALSVALTQQMLMICVYAIITIIFLWKNQLKFSDLNQKEVSKDE